MVVARTSRQRAVNMLLEFIGMPGTVTWADAEAGPSSAELNEATAVNCLEDAVRQINLENQYQWNWREEKTYTADGSGLVALAGNIARVDYVEAEKQWQGNQDRLVEKAGYLYNLTDDTTNFGAGATVKLKITFWPEFKDLPESARQYAIAVARIPFVIATKGSDSILIQKAERMAFIQKLVMEKDNGKREKRNMLERDDRINRRWKRTPYTL